VLINARIKSIFIFPAVAISMLLLGIALWQAFLGGNERTAWLGAAIAALPLPLLMMRLMLTRVERTSDNLPILLSMSASGVLVAVWEQFLEGTTGWAPLSAALVNLFILLLYIFWYSRFGRYESPHLSVGSKLPHIELKDSDGAQFDSESLLGSPAILLFYRGNWCPLCMAQIKEIADRYQELDELGIKVVLVSPQPDELSRKLAKSHKVPFRFLVDSDNKVAETLGIAVKHGVPVGMPGGYAPDTVMPTLVVTNAQGTIVYSDQTDNYRVRPEPDTFLAILRRAGVVSK
jgi:peroxiredoxin